MSFWNWFQRPDFQILLEQARASGAQIIDVRTAEEYRQGHVPGSRNIPLAQIHTLRHGSAPLYLYCQSGARSGAACRLLKSRGYEARNIGGLFGYAGELEEGEGA